jgi:hypothetical protein
LPHLIDRREGISLFSAEKHRCVGPRDMERPLHCMAMNGCVSFSLVETLIANGVVVAVVLGVAQLFAVTTEMNRRAATQTWMAICAVQKMEELRTIGSDSAAGVEYLDGHGMAVPAAVAIYEREWSVGPFPSDSEGLILVDVIVRSVTRPIEARAIGVRQKGR